jgi:hypothetical protein
MQTVFCNPKRNTAAGQMGSKNTGENPQDVSKRRKENHVLCDTE